MGESPDFKELLRALNEKKAEYPIVGGYAVMKYTECLDSEFIRKCCESIRGPRRIRGTLEERRTGSRRLRE